MSTAERAEDRDGQVLLSLAMIVRDGGPDLERCLRSAAGCADEVVVVDTGSRDGSERLARRLGARVLRHRWRDDFAAARNAGLRACRGRWVLVLDADEALAPTDAAAMRRWAAAADRAGALAGALVETRNYRPRPAEDRGWRPLPARDRHAWPDGAPAPGFVPTRKVRIFPRHEGIRFEGCLHEIVDRSLLRAGGRIRAIPAVVHHWGLLAPSQRKSELYLRLARRKAELAPRDPQAWSELADCLQATGDVAAAVAAAARAAALAPAEPRHALKLGALLYAGGRAAEAEAPLTAAAAAAGAAERAEALHLLGLIRLRGGRADEAGPLLLQAARLAPGRGLHWNSLGAWLLLQRRGTEALRALQRALALLPGHPDPPLNLGILWEGAGRPGEARRWYERALAADAACAEARRRLRRLAAAPADPVAPGGAAVPAAGPEPTPAPR